MTAGNFRVVWTHIPPQTPSNADKLGNKTIETQPTEQADKLESINPEIHGYRTADLDQIKVIQERIMAANKAVDQNSILVKNMRTLVTKPL